MTTPDITQAQGGTAAAFLAVALGLPATGASDAVLIAALVCATVLGAATVIADALIRRGRANVVASETLAYGVDVTGAMDVDEVEL
jgi:hypothetical protein